MSTKTTTSKLRSPKAPAISRIGQRRQVVIPKEIFDALQLAEGDFLEVTAVAGQVAMKRKKLVDDDDVLSPAEAVKVRHAQQQAASGKVKPWASVKHELGL